MVRLGRGYPSTSTIRIRRKPPAPPVPLFDAMGTSVPNPNSVPNLTWTHNGAAGGRVFIPVAYSGTTPPTSVTYGGITVPLLGSPSIDGSNNTYLYFYTLAGIPGGPQNVVVTAAGNYVGANSISFTGVNSMSALQTKNDGGTTTTALTQSVSCSANQIIVQSFGEWPNDTITAYSGGTSRWIGNFNGIAGDGAITLSTATTTTTFTATDGTSTSYAGLAVVLS